MTTATRTPKRIEQRPLPESAAMVDAEAERLGLHDRIERLQNELANARKDLLEENGICLKCKGFGGSWHRMSDYDAWCKCEGCDGVGAGERAANEAIRLEATLDYDDEARADFAAYHELQARYERAEALANNNFAMAGGCKGLLMEVYKGRKIKVGTRGVCFWIGSSQWGDRVGLQVEGQAEPVWVALDNCRVVFADSPQ